MNILEFCDKNNIKWFPIKLGGRNNKEAQPIRNECYKNKTHYVPTYKEFETISRETLIQRQQLIDDYEYVAIDTYDINQIDCDTRESAESMKEIMKTQPYYLSMTKNLPHIFAYLDCKKMREEVKNEDENINIDLLSGQWGYVNKNIDVINGSKLINKIDIETIHKYCKINKKINKKVNKKAVIIDKKIDDDIIPINIDETKYIELMNLFSVDVVNSLSYDEWLKIGIALYNESSTLINVYKSFSKKSKKYDEDEINKKWISFKDEINNPIKLATIIYYLKLKSKDDNIIFEWSMKYNLDFAFWQQITNQTHYDIAQLYYSLNPDKYIYSKNDKHFSWFEYDDNNIIIKHGSSVPTSLISSIAKIIRPYIIKKRNELIMPLKETMTDEEFKKETKIYENQLKQCLIVYNKVGDVKFEKGIISHLPILYNKPNFYKLIDSNQNLVAFNNMLFDYTTCTYRKILATDYISNTVEYDYRQSKPEIRKIINNLLLEIFNTEEIAKYYLLITAMSLFTNKYESLYCLTGEGSNGKGVLSSLIEKSFGKYFAMAENTFLTKKMNDEKNPTLTKAHGIRYLLITEPQRDEKEGCKLNIDFVKSITGRDAITCRDLFQSTITYNPIFTPFLQCNKKPTLDELDNAIIRRLKVIKFPFIFNDIQTEKHHKKINREIKDIVKNDVNYHNEFLLMLIEIAVANKNVDIIIPKDCINETKIYLDENNIIKDWITHNLIKCDNIKKEDGVILTVARLNFNNFIQDPEKIIKTNTKFKEKLLYNKIETRLLDGIDKLKHYIIKYDDNIDT